AGRGDTWTGVRVELEGNEQGRLGTYGKRPSRELSFPGAERGTGDPLTRAELRDRQTTGELSPEALPPGRCKVEVFGACHELAPGLEKRDQPSSIAAVARLDLPCAYGDRGAGAGADGSGGRGSGLHLLRLRPAGAPQAGSFCEEESVEKKEGRLN